MYLARRTSSYNLVAAMFQLWNFSHHLNYLCGPCAAKYADYKTSWPPEPIGHKSWKGNRGSSQSQLSRPPPGLASQKQPSSSPWSGGGPRLAGRGWGSGSSTTGNSSIHLCCLPPTLHIVFHWGTMSVTWFCSVIQTISRRPSELTQRNRYTNLMLF